MKYFLIYLIIINVISFACFGADKRRARKHKWRISEGMLFLLAIAGGSIGAMIGMYVFHHKTRHWYFKFGLPCILIVQIAVVWFLVSRHLIY